MKKLSVLIMLGVLVYAGTSTAKLTLKGYQDLKYYQARNLDEEKIVKLALNYQKAYNLYDPKGVLAVYLPGAIIKAGIKVAGLIIWLLKKNISVSLLTSLPNGKCTALN